MSEIAAPPAPPDRDPDHEAPGTLDEVFLRSNLTFRQYQFWTAQNLTPEFPLERLTRWFWLPPDLLAVFDAAWRGLGEQSDAIRSILQVSDDVPSIIFASEAEPPRRIDMPGGADIVRQLESFAWQSGFFRFSDGDRLYRHLIVNLDDGRAAWLLQMSHLVSDGRSGDILVDLVFKAMTALANGRTLPRFDIPSLAENMHRERIADLARLRSQSFPDPWAERLSGYQTQPAFYGVTPKPVPTRRVVGGQLLTRELTTALLRSASGGPWFSHSALVTATNIQLALQAVFAWRISGQRRHVIATTTHGRNADEMGLLGYKSRMLPIRIEVEPDEPFHALVRAVHEEVSSARKVLAPYAPGSVRDPGYVMRSNFQYLPPSGNGSVASLVSLDVPIASGTSEWLSMRFGGRPEVPDRIHFTVAINEEVAAVATPAEIEADFIRGLEAVIANPMLSPRTIPFADPAVQARLTRAAEPGLADAPDWLVRWAAGDERWVDSPAIVHGSQAMTHREFAAEARAWATLLARNGIGSGDRVLVVGPSSNPLSAAWLGLMSREAVYVPVNAALPVQPMLRYVDAIRPAAVLCEPSLVARFRDVIDTVIALEPLTPTEEDLLPLQQPRPEAVAHIFHTSGSTGQPKPIAVTHAALSACIDSWIRVNELQPGERIAHFYAITFDPWLTGLIPALRLGGTCIVIDNLKPPAWSELASILENREVGTLCTPTAYFHAVGGVTTPQTVKRWIVGGEALAADKAMRFMHANPATRLINAYGPTETTIWASVLTVRAEHHTRVPVGAPMPTCAFRVCDEAGDVQLPGVPGELWISGPQVAIGYVGQPALTAQQFVERDNTRWYRTGDLVRWRRDGDLDFLGRIDRQVKIRGHRIEPGEIEIVLRALDIVGDAVVTAVDDASGPSLCGYFIPAKGIDTPTDGQLRSALLRSLPEYKVPRWLIALDAFPTNANGKIDTARLPQPSLHTQGSVADYLPSLTLWDLRIIFEHVLGIPRVGIDESFFDLGGDSLRLVELLGAIESRFGRRLDATEVMASPTIGGLAPLLEGVQSDRSALVIPLKGGSAAPLFCIPGAGGIGVEFYPLSRRLPGDRPVVVLRSSGTDGRAPPPSSADALLTEHVDQILAWRRSHGEQRPVLLMGYSLGGIFAWEIAQRLQAQGTGIGGIFLIDAHIATRAGRSLMSGTARGFLHRIREFLFGSGTQREQQRLAATFDERRRAGAVMEAAALGRYNLLAQAALYRRIISRPAGFPTVYFLASRGPRHAHAQLWATLASNLVVHEIEGDHQGEDAIVREPHVAALAQRVADTLEQAGM